jgi:hypothetical protein
MRTLFRRFAPWVTALAKAAGARKYPKISRVLPKCLGFGMVKYKSLIISLGLASAVLSSCGFSSTSETTTTTEAITTTTTIPAIQVAFSLTVPGLSVGDCFNNSANVIQIDCSELHDGQVIATDIRLDYTLIETAYASLWESDAEDKCAVNYKNFVGHEYKKDESRFKISLLLTDANSTLVSCTVVDQEGDKWAGTAENFVGSYEGVEIGDCFMFPTDINDAIVVSCTQPHEGEMFLKEKPVSITSKDAPYPTRNEWRDIAYGICDKPFLAYAGVSESDKTLSYSFIYPLEGDWGDVNQRTISCIATSYNGERLSYSVRR